MLVTQCGLSSQAAAIHTPHGLRGVLNTAGQQLWRRGHVGEKGFESLAHWQTGSNMRGKYDAASGVWELDTRSVIVGALSAAQLRRTLQVSKLLVQVICCSVWSCASKEEKARVPEALNGGPSQAIRSDSRNFRCSTVHDDDGFIDT